MATDEHMEAQDRQAVEFGQWLALERKRALLSQAQAADIAGVSRAQWARWEAGGGMPKRANIPLVAKGIRSTDIGGIYRRAGYQPPSEYDEPNPPEEKPVASPDPDEALILYIYRLADGELKMTIREKIAEALHTVSTTQRHHMAAEAAKREQRDIDTEIVTQTEGLLTRAERETGKRVG